jgi:tetratricopeptide (TPR) repeat protein
MDNEYLKSDLRKLKKGIGKLYDNTMGFAGWAAENPDVVGETVAKIGSYALPGSSIAEVTGGAPEIIGEGQAPGISELLRQGKYGEAAAMASFLGLDLAQLSGAGFIPATGAKVVRGTLRGIDELGDAYAASRRLSVESGGPPIGGGGQDDLSPTRKQLQQMIGAEQDPVRKAELIEQMKAMGSKETAKGTPKVVQEAPPPMTPIGKQVWVNNEGSYSLSTETPFSIVRNVERGIATLPERGTGDQILQHLLNKGVSKTELKNSGLGSFLQQNEATMLSSDEVTNFYRDFAPQITIKDAGQQFEEAQRLGYDITIPDSYSMKVFSETNPNRAGTINDYGHLSENQNKGMIGHMRIADTDGSTITFKNRDGNPGLGRYQIVNEVQDDLGKVRKQNAVYDEVAKRGEDAVLSEYTGKVERAVNNLLLNVENDASARFNLYSRVDEYASQIPELQKASQDSPYYAPAELLRDTIDNDLNGYKDTLAEISNTFKSLDRSEHDAQSFANLKYDVQRAATDYVRAAPLGGKSLVEIAEALDANQKALGIPQDLIDDLWEHATFVRNKEDMRARGARGNELYLISDTAGQALLDADRSFDTFFDVVEVVRDPEAVVAEMTPDFVAKLRSESSQKAHEQWAENAFSIRQDIEALTKEIEELGGAPEMIGAKRTSEQLDIQMRLLGLEKELKQASEHFKAAAPERYKVSGAKYIGPVLRKNFTRSDVFLSDGEGDIIRPTTDLDKLLDNPPNPVLPNAIGDSKGTHAALFDLMLEDAVASGKTGVIIPSAQSIADAGRGGKASEFKFIYEDIANSAIKRFQKRYPDATVDEINVGSGDGDFDGILVKFNGGKATEPLVQKFARGGLVMGGIGAMGREVL